MHPRYALAVAVVAFLLNLIPDRALAAAAYDISKGELVVPKAFELTDARDAKELKGGLPLFKDPTYTIPEKRFSPGLVALLGSELEGHLGEKLTGRQVTVDKFLVQFYFGATYRHNQSQSVAITGAALTGDWVVTAIAEGKDVDAALVRLLVKIDDQTYAVDFAKAVAMGDPPMLYMGMVYDRKEARAVIREAVHGALEQLVARIGEAGPNASAVVQPQSPGT